METNEIVLIKINKWLKKNKMKSKICSQIHDDIVINIHNHEKDIIIDYLKSEGIEFDEKIEMVGEK